MYISEQKRVPPNVSGNNVSEAKQVLQTRLNSHTQEQDYRAANSSVSQNSHPIFSLSIFTFKEYLQNPIKKQPRKILFITHLGIKL